LWGALADGKRQHVRDLATLLGCDAHALNGHWKQLPAEMQKHLRQHDGWWQLKQAMAVVSPVTGRICQRQLRFSSGCVA
jgi:hypothetical protein